MSFDGVLDVSAFEFFDDLLTGILQGQMHGDHIVEKVTFVVIIGR